MATASGYVQEAGQQHKVNRRDWDARKRARRAFLLLTAELSADTVERIASILEQEIEQPATSSPEGELIHDLLGREYSQEERAELEAYALTQSFRRRQELLQDTLTAPQVAKLLHVSRQTPHDRVKSKRMLAVMDRGMLRFPAWQFDQEQGEVIEGLPRVVQALHMPALSQISWFLQPNPFLTTEDNDSGSTPLEVLKSGEVERVVDLARGAGRT